MSATTSPAIAEGSTDDWLSRPKLAQLAHCSEQSIDRDIKKHGFEHRTLPNGTKIYRLGDFVEIGRIVATDIPNGLTAKQAIEVLRLQEKVAELTRENGQLIGRLEAFESTVAILSDQLEVKDAQIKKAEGNLSTALSVVAGWSRS